MSRKTDKNERRNPKPQTVFVCAALLVLSYLVFFSVAWYKATYGDTGFESVVFTLTSGMDGVQTGLITSYLKGGVLPAVLFSASTVWLVFFRFERVITVTAFNRLKLNIFPFKRKVKVLIAVILSVILVFQAAIGINFVRYLINQSQSTLIFDREYVSPDSVEILFPEEKKNLILISVESLETTFMSKEEGGALDYNLIPSLFELAKNNINFSDTDNVGGSIKVSGTTWTAGAMVAHTTGLPLKVPLELQDNTYGKNSFLPGATTLYEVLRDNGYYQAVMMGCDSHFANSNVYYTQHGVNKIYDYYAARDDGLFPEGYKVWWGYEDKLLYKYAKQTLTEIAKGDQPFSFTIKTVDTHHIDGYVCSECKDEYSEQYENVFACADRQLAEFIEWLQVQPFYENTVIVITGDHETMDSGYITRNVDSGYERRVYNCIINSSAVAVKSKNRQFSALDLFPTILASVGCEIEGNRLGLGTNLFSDKPTLLEEMGTEKFDEQISRHSSFYNNRFIYVKPQNN